MNATTISSAAFVEKLQRAGVDCTVDIAQDMPHNPTLFAAYHPAAKAALDIVA